MAVERVCSFLMRRYLCHTKIAAACVRDWSCFAFQKQPSNSFYLGHHIRYRHVHTSALKTKNGIPLCYNKVTSKKHSGQSQLERPFSSSKHNYYFHSQSMCSRASTDNGSADSTSENSKLMTVQEAIKHWIGKFVASNVPEAEISAKYIIAHAVGLKQVRFLELNYYS